MALVFEGLQITYGELNRRANRLARYLRARGAALGELVGVCLERGCDLITSLLGIFKAGAVYLPLDPGYPESRLRFMLEDSGVRTVVARDHEDLAWAGDVPALIRIESVWAAAADDGGENLDLW